jgi:hypothetical protein
MRIFVAYGFHEPDRWIPEHVISIVRAFGFEVVDGEGLYGEVLSGAVLQRIKTCDDVMAFVTRRDQEKPGSTTHRWVEHELASALGQGIRILDVREVGLDDKGGMTGDRHRIAYDPAQLVTCIVEIAKALGEWHKRQSKFLPTRDTLYEEMAPSLGQRGFRCQYRVNQREIPSLWREGRIVRQNGRLYFVAEEDFQEGSSLELTVSVPSSGRMRRGRSYISDVEPLTVDNIGLSDQNPEFEEPDYDDRRPNEHRPTSLRGIGTRREE